MPRCYPAGMAANRRPIRWSVMATTVSDVYDLPQEHKDLRETIRQIAEERIRPRAADIDRSGEYPWDVRKLLAEQDILALALPAEYGGAGTRALMLPGAVAGSAHACASAGLIPLIQGPGPVPVQMFGPDQRKGRFLPPCATGAR